jgi:toxin-antitoxin system PIN domain toxin
MTSYFPDINVWLALAVEWHPHSDAAWEWMNGVPKANSIYFSRHTQMGLLRLLCTEQVMGKKILTTKQAWHMHDQLLDDLRVRLEPEPVGLSEIFRSVTQLKGRESAPKFLADAYIIAFAQATGSKLVTFDRALSIVAHAGACTVIIPGA